MDKDMVNVQIASETGLVEKAFSRAAWRQVLGALEVGLVGAEFRDEEEADQVSQWLSRLDSDV